MDIASLLSMGSLIGSSCDPLAEEELVCNICSNCPLYAVTTACGHFFCWPCMSQFLQGQAKPCPVCSTMLSSPINVVPKVTDSVMDFGLVSLYLPSTEELEPTGRNEHNITDGIETSTVNSCSCGSSCDLSAEEFDGCTICSDCPLNALMACDPSEEQEEELVCNICSNCPRNSVMTACGHLFCWSCMHQFLQDQAKPCPVCTTMLSSSIDVVAQFNDFGTFSLYLPSTEELERTNRNA